MPNVLTTDTFDTEADAFNENVVQGNQYLLDRLENGLVLEDNKKYESMKDRWVLVWRMNKNGSVKKNANIYWFHCGPLVEDVAEFKGRYFPEILETELPPAVPFPIDTNFKRSFVDIMSDAAWSEEGSLGGKLNSGSFACENGANNPDMLVEFWRKVQARYQEIIYHQ